MKKEPHHESHSRSIVKSITWRVLATLTTGMLVYLFTGNFSLAIEVGVIEILAKIIIYYVHERIWVKTKWGKKEVK